MGEDHIVMGSDYPHPEGIPSPAMYGDLVMGKLSDTGVRKFMRSNLAGLLTLPA